VATVQNLYNLTNRRSRTYCGHCEAVGIGFIPWFPLARGRARAARRAGRRRRGGARRDAGPGRARVVLLQRSEAMLPIPGTSSVSHLEENVRGGRADARSRTRSSGSTPPRDGLV
jgi:aryl-alcohol dehydrogenase-like predicted oxidoreductase